MTPDRPGVRGRVDQRVIARERDAGHGCGGIERVYRTAAHGNLCERTAKAYAEDQPPSVRRELRRFRLVRSRERLGRARLEIPGPELCSPRSFPDVRQGATVG